VVRRKAVGCQCLVGAVVEGADLVVAALRSDVVFDAATHVQLGQARTKLARL